MRSDEMIPVARRGAFIPSTHPTFPNAVVRGINFRDATDPAGTQGLFVDPWAPLALHPSHQS